jgi:geranylgeranyl diphosphate synthase, type II
VVTDPAADELRRIRRADAARAFALFDLEEMPRAIAALRGLASTVPVVAARGRVVPSDAIDVFEELWLGSRLLERLAIEDGPMPKRWKHPVVAAEMFGAERMGVVFSKLPDAGALDFADFGRDGRREGAPAAVFAGARSDVAPGDLSPVLEDFARAGLRRVLLVDGGGAPGPLAEDLLRLGSLGGYFTRASRGVPEIVRAAGVPIYIWFEPEDRGRIDAKASRDACALIPVGLVDETPDAAEERVRALRRRGFSAVAPRFHIPVPATREWRALSTAAPIRHEVGEPLDGRVPVFATQGWDLASASAFVRRCALANRLPRPASGGPAPPTAYSLAAISSLIDGYLSEARRSAHEPHARDLMAEVLRKAGTGRLEPHFAYPFLSWNGESLLDLVDGAVDARLRSIDGAPEPLYRSLRHTALAGGKRLRPVLAVAVGLANGARLDAVLPAALALEWLHTASLVQDDLPSMDDDPVRRRAASAHVRHGEGLALLASDGLVALAFEDLASLAENRAVGGLRASRLVAAFARELGAFGVVGGQALDLEAREKGSTDLVAQIEIHRRKTAPFFRLAATIGAVLTDLPDERRRPLEAALGSLGVAFQLVDDLLDDDAVGQSSVTAASRRKSAAVARQLARPASAIEGPHVLRGAFARIADFVLARSA